MLIIVLTGFYCDLEFEIIHTIFKSFLYFRMGLVLVLLIIYAIWDLNYFIRCICTLGFATFFQKKRKITEKTTVYGKKKHDFDL